MTTNPKPGAPAHVNIPTVAGTIAGVELQLIDARTLHEAVQSKRAFAHWIKERIEQLGLEEGRDYLKVNRRPDKGSRFESFDFHLLPLAALRIALVQRSYRGSYSPRMEDLQRQLDEQRAQYLQAHPECKQALRYLAMNLSDAERARLMGWSIEHWNKTIADMHTAGLLGAQAQAAAA